MMHRAWMACLAAAAAILAGCSGPSEARYPELTFTHLTPIRFAVGRIEVVDEYVPPMRAPHVEQDFPVTPSKAAHRWVQDRLVAGGGEATLRITIRRADAVSNKLKTSDGIKGFFTDEQAERIDANLNVTIEIFPPQTLQRVAFAEASATHSKTLAESTSLRQREDAYFDIAGALVKDMDVQMEKQIRTHLVPFLL